MSGATDRQQVVVVHGLWFGAWAMRPLARRLRRSGNGAVRVHSYRSTRADLDQHARTLQAFLAQRPADTRHFVAHSLGGLVVLRLFDLFPEQPPGRIVFLGSPLLGSRVARKAHRIPGVRRLLGQVQPELEAGYARLPEAHPAGMIAGTRRFGLGLLVGELRAPGDGTVLLDETRAKGLAEHMELPVTHTGLVLSTAVVRHTSSFLQTGSFVVKLAV